MWSFRYIFLLLLLVVAVPAAAKTLIVNANGYSIDANGKVKRFATVLIDDNGRLLEILSRGKREPRLTEGDYRLDAGGRTLLPGFIDSHGDVMALGLKLRGWDTAHMAEASAGERELALEKALAHLAARGITGVHDMGTSAADWALYRAFADEGRLTLRITAYADGMRAMEAIAPLRPTPWLYDGRLRLQGVRIVVDGSVNDHAAWLQTPYADRPEHSGAPLLDDAQVKNLLSRANYLGYQALAEAHGDAAVSHVLDSFAEIRPAYSGRFRNRVECATVIDPEDRKRFRELETIISIQPDRAMAEWRMLETRLGATRAHDQHAWRELMAVDARLVLGAGTASILDAVYAAVTRKTSATETDDQALSVAQALAGFTRSAAYAGHMEQHVGSLEPGKWADFILLDRDPFAIPAAEIPSIRVLETWVAGGRVYQAEP